MYGHNLYGQKVYGQSPHKERTQRVLRPDEGGGEEEREKKIP